MMLIEGPEIPESAPDKMTVTGFWATSRRAKKVHYFPAGDTRSICGMSRHYDFVNQAGWDINDELTCENCKKQIKWFLRGFVLPPETVQP
jgi:hypothetical protein